MTKLLDKPLKAFTTYALIVLLGSIPVYFLIIDLIWVHEINEHNLIVAKTTIRNLEKLDLDEKEMEQAITFWNQLHPETKLQKTVNILADSTYNVYRKDLDANVIGYDRFQGLVKYFRYRGQNYSLTVEANVEESYETILAITLVTLLFFVILLLGFIRLNRKISKKVFRPFYDTLEKIKAFDLTSHKTIDFESSSILEFEELTSSINKLVVGNVAAFHQQKEFTENASHELQTPLAIIQSKLDLLLQDELITTGQSLIIEEANNALSRVSRINKNLLLLARMENQQFLEQQSINLSEKLIEILDLLGNLFADRAIIYEVEDEPVVDGNVILIEIMLTNLIMNALRHSVPHREITVRLDNTRLIVSNAGAYPLNKERLFKRFSTTSAHTPGSGLGLSIIQEICLRYRWTLNYDYVDDNHRFTVDF